jgi:hypothetical protein
VWRYTPAETFGHLHFARLRRLDEMREDLAIAALGASGNHEAIEKQLREWGE